MAKQTYAIIEGFLFTDEQAAARARKEADSIRFLKGKMDKGNPAQMLALYQKMIDQRMFQTPVGYAFLAEIQEYLVTKPTIRPDEIPAIPVERGLDARALAKDAFENRARSVEQVAKEELERRDEKKGIVEGAAKEVANDEPKKKNAKQSKATIGLSLFLNIILAAIVVGMFAVSYTRGSTTILNYESDIIDKYEAWEEELEEREKKVEEKEAILGIEADPDEYENSDNVLSTELLQ